MAALKRLLRLGIKSESCLAGLRASSAYSTSSSPSSSIRRFGCRQFSQLVKSNGTRACLFDTLALVRSLEAQGVPSMQAEAITSAVNEVLNDRLESFVLKVEMQKTKILQESSLSNFKSEVTSSQKHHLSLFQRETEKLRGDINKMRSELKYEIDKIATEQRLDLNLERGQILEELANQNAETTNLTNKLEREIDALRTQLEAEGFRTPARPVCDFSHKFECQGRGSKCPKGNFWLARVMVTIFLGFVLGIAFKSVL